MKIIINDLAWVKYNEITDMYDTRDGATVPAYLIENACCISDVMHIAKIRKEQRRELDKT